MEIINYPGSICHHINDIIDLSPERITRGWLHLFHFVLFYLAGTTLYRTYKQNKRLDSNYLNWLFSGKAFILTLCVGVLILRIPNLILPELNVDESQWVAGAASYFNGTVLWKHLSGGTSGPLVFIPLSIMVPIDGLNYTTVRLFGLLFCIIPSIYLIWKTLSLLYGEIIARYSVILLFLLFATTNTTDFIAYNSEHVPMLLSSLAIFFYFSLIQNSSFPLKKIISLGIVLGLFPYAKLQAVPIGLSIGLLALFQIIKSNKINYIFIFILFVLIPSIVAGIYLTINNCWIDFWKDYILDNIIYSNNGLALTGVEPIHGFHKLVIPFILFPGLESKLIVSFFIFLLVIIPIFRFNKRAFTEIYSDQFVASSIFIALAAYASVIIPGNDFQHYMLLFVFPFVFMAGTIIGKLSGIEKTKPLKYAWIICFFTSITFYAKHIDNPAKKGVWYASLKEKYQLSDISKTILKYAHPNERMAVWGWGGSIYVETGLIQSSPAIPPYHTMTRPQDDNNLVRYVNDMASTKPVIFLDAVSKTSFVFRLEKYKHEHYQKLNDFVTNNYTQISECNGERIYVLNSRLESVSNKYLKFN